MNDTTFKTAVEAVAKAIDGAGVLALIVGLLLATVLFLRGLRGGDSEAAYKPYRQRIGRSILLSLEFLVAADIIRTVALEPTFRGVGVLAIVVLVRTFLSFTLEVDLKVAGRGAGRAPRQALACLDSRSPTWSRLKPLLTPRSDSDLLRS